MRDYPHIHGSILFGFPGHSDDAIAKTFYLQRKIKQPKYAHH